jgi:hypothetical protein
MKSWTFCIIVIHLDGTVFHGVDTKVREMCDEISHFVHESR